jgi:hypothetical protein
MLNTSACEFDMQIEGDLHVPIVRNTFIEVAKPSDRPERRHRTVPADLRLLLQSDDTFSEATTRPSTPSSTVASDGSSDVGSSDCTSGQSENDPCLPFDDINPSMIQSASRGSYNRKVNKIITRVAKRIEDSELVSRVLVSSTSQAYSMVVQVHGNSSSLTQEVSALAQKELLQIAKESKSIYILGFCTPQAFKMRSRGFDTTLVSMENASKACWHIFKKGFCRHGVECVKQHPGLNMPLQVFVETA